MNSKYRWATYLWLLQVLTGLALTLYIILHTIDNGAILISPEKFNEMLRFWHDMPDWIYNTMVVGLVGVFILHMLNGIRIASKAYMKTDVSGKHLLMLKHPGTWFWFIQVLTGSIVAIFGGWHLIVQHSGHAVETAADSAENVTPLVFLIYIIFLGAAMFHSFNGIRSVMLKLGYATSKAKENILIGVMALLFVTFFVVGVASMAKFLPGRSVFENVAGGTGQVDADDDAGGDQQASDEEDVEEQDERDNSGPGSSDSNDEDREDRSGSDRGSDSDKPGRESRRGN
jgi:succinate dehydrogenase/fumarate reductase cytochrome b subunit